MISFSRDLIIIIDTAQTQQYHCCSVTNHRVLSKNIHYFTRDTHTQTDCINTYIKISEIFIIVQSVANYEVVRNLKANIWNRENERGKLRERGKGGETERKREREEKAQYTAECFKIKRFTERQVERERRID